jgi:FtsZ-binding cell division protein ZapB
MSNPARNGTANNLGQPIKPTSVTETDIKELQEQRNPLEQEKNNLTGELNKLKKKVSEAEEERKTLAQEMKTLTEKNITLEAEVDSHKQEIEELKEKIVELKRELKNKDDDIKSLEARITNLEQQEVVKSLEARITNLEEEGRRDKSDQDTLYISQAGYQFEQAICTYVLPDVFKNDKHATIESLLEYLHNQRGLDVSIPDPSGKLLLEGRKRWDKVCVHLNLPISEGVGNFTKWGLYESSTPNIIKALDLLKKERRTVAHPRPISLKLAGKKLHAVKGKMPQWHFNLIEGFVASVQNSIENSGSEIYKEHFQLD